MAEAVQENVGAAAEYIRYRNSDRDKAELLFTYLTERFSYHTQESTTPLYDALCRGVADPEGLAQAWQIICDQAGMECYTVSGLCGGEPHTWNIITTDENSYRHVDLAQNVLENHELQLLTDEEMVEYYWDTEEYPVCEASEEVQSGEEAPTEEQPPAVEHPVEADPPADEELPIDPLEPDENPMEENPSTESE